MPDIDKPVVIVLTIHPPKKKSRAVTVSAAPAGEMPLLLTGQFADRHALADQAYAQLLKRKPQTVKVTKGLEKYVAKIVAKHDPEADKPDQLVRSEEPLPAIEGDALEVEPQPTEAQLADYYENKAVEESDALGQPQDDAPPAPEDEAQARLF